jgi:Arm DNA-binding domain
MERDTFNILFYFRKNKLKNDGKAPLLMRITVNGKRWDSALKVGVDPKYWNQQKEKVIGGDDRDSNLVNETIESTKFRLHKIKLGLEDERKPLQSMLLKIDFLIRIKINVQFFHFIENTMKNAR